MRRNLLGYARLDIEPDRKHSLAEDTSCAEADRGLDKLEDRDRLVALSVEEARNRQGTAKGHSHSGRLACRHRCSHQMRLKPSTSES